MNNKIKLILLCATFGVFQISAQENSQCGGYFPEAVQQMQICSQSSSAYTNKYRLQSSYIPNTNPYVDEVVIPINLIVIADDFGNQGAYTPAEWASQQANALYWLNRVFTQTQQPTDPAPGYPNSYWLTETNDTKIRFEINQVFFYNNSSLFNAPFNGSGSAIRTHHLATHPEAQNFINCYLAKNSYPGAGGASWQSSIEPRIISFGWNDPNDQYATWPGSYWYWAQHLPHELGHQLGLCHTYSGSACTETLGGYDFLSDVFFNPPAHENCPGINPASSPTDFCTNNLMSGKEYNEFVSPLQAGKMHRQLRLSSIKNFAYGYSSIPHEITSNETWDFTYKSYNNIVVKGGATLTLTCRLEMVKGSKIIIEPGAKLVVDGGTITSAKSAGPENEGWWQGIEVWGNPSLNQNNATNQGQLITKNNAIIEHAHEAISVWKPNDWNSMGGIVDCSNTTFRNNWRSCAYMPYHSFNATNTIEYPNKGKFSRCNFEWDNAFLSNSINCGISMFHVNGVTISGCNFVDNRTGTVTDRPNGITSIDAGYKVFGIDLNPGPISNPNIDHYYDETDFVVSTFTNLENGVNAMSMSALYPVTVDHSKFTNCEIGVLLDAMDNAAVTRNKFEKNASYHLSNPTMLQLVARNTTGYKIEGNLFSNFNSLNGAGTAIFNSGQENNFVYRNKFNGLSESNYANGFNTNDLSNANSKGLAWSCNEMQNSVYDLYDYVTVPNTPVGDGVKLIQGSNLGSAGNLFSSSITGGAPSHDRHFYQLDPDAVRYYHFGGITEPTQNQGPVITSGLVSVGQNQCPSSFQIIRFGAGKLLSPENQNIVEQDLEDVNENLTAKSSALNSLLQKGDEAELHNAVLSLNLSNRQSVKTLLKSESPYLSASLLENLGKVDPTIFPHDWYRDLIIENIEIAFDKDFVSNLSSKAYPMPDGYINDIKNAMKTKVTERGEKEIEIVSIVEQKNSLENLLVQNQLSDDSEINWEETQERLIAQNRELVNADLVSTYFSRQMIDAATSTLSAIENSSENYNLPRTSKDMEEFAKFNRYILSITGNTGKIQSLNEQQIAELSQMTIEFGGKASRLAQNTLCFFANICEPVKLVLDGKENDDDKSNFQSQPFKQQEKVLEVGVYPNPNTGSFALVLPDECEISEIYITDLAGKKQEFETYNVRANINDISIKNVESGIYIVRATCKDGSIYSNRIILSKK